MQKHFHTKNSNTYIFTIVEYNMKSWLYHTKTCRFAPNKLTFPWSGWMGFPEFLSRSGDGLEWKVKFKKNYLQKSAKQPERHNDNFKYCLFVGKLYNKKWKISHNLFARNRKFQHYKNIKEYYINNQILDGVFGITLDVTNISGGTAEGNIIIIPSLKSK